MKLIISFFLFLIAINSYAFVDENRNTDLSKPPVCYANDGGTKGNGGPT